MLAPITFRLATPQFLCFMEFFHFPGVFFDENTVKHWEIMLFKLMKMCGGGGGGQGSGSMSRVDGSLTNSSCATYVRGMCSLAKAKPEQVMLMQGPCGESEKNGQPITNCVIAFPQIGPTIWFWDVFCSVGVATKTRLESSYAHVSPSFYLCLMLCSRACELRARESDGGCVPHYPPPDRFHRERLGVGRRALERHLAAAAGSATGYGPWERRIARLLATSTAG